MITVSIPNKEEFNRVYEEVTHGVPLNLKMVGDIFGQEFWMLLVLVQTNIRVNTDGILKVEVITDPKNADQPERFIQG